ARFLLGRPPHARAVQADDQRRWLRAIVAPRHVEYVFALPPGGHERTVGRFATRNDTASTSTSSTGRLNSASTAPMACFPFRMMVGAVTDAGSTRAPAAPPRFARGGPPGSR